MGYAPQKIFTGLKHCFVRAVFVSLLIGTFAAAGFAQTCSVSATSPNAHVEGLAELVGDLNVACTGGAGGTINTLVVVSLNANVTNRLDVNGNLVGVTLTGAGVTNDQVPVLNSANVVLFSSVNVPGTSPVFTISGIRVAIPTATGTGSTNPFINASVSANHLSISTQPVVAAISGPSLASSVFNYGLPCTGSPTPATIDIPTLISSGTVSSTVRVTEATVSSFAPRTAGADFGVRILVSIAGYGSNATVYVPDVIVGNRGQVPTTSGAFGAIASGGTYVPGQNSLLLTRVSGADGTGLGGVTVLSAPPTVATTFTTASQVPLVNGSATITYEVLDANGAFTDSAQIPVYVALPVTNCSATPSTNTLAASLAPVSTVSIPTQTDPIPRYIASKPASDCTIIGDCSATYFPILQSSPASINLTGSSQGPTQNGYITLTNGGSNQFTFNVTTTYQTADGLSTANWITLSATTGSVGPTAGVSNFTLVVAASPAALLVPGTYNATVTINAGSAGTVSVPVTFTVSPAGPIIQSLVNAANAQQGPVTAGSFASIYGVNLVPKNPPAQVTFNGFPATVSYDGQPSANGPSQVNVLVPAALGAATTAGVVVTVDGVPSNTFPIQLVTNAPAVFNPGILNQNNTVNLPGTPASRGDILQIFLTGMSTPVPLSAVTVNIGTASLTGNQLAYAGPVVSVPGLEQVNAQVPPALSFTGNSVSLSICLQFGGAAPTCSAPVSLYLQ